MGESKVGNYLLQSGQRARCLVGLEKSWLTRRFKGVVPAALFTAIGLD